MIQYEINEETLAIVPINENCSQVYELHQSFLVDKNVHNTIEDSCLYFGSTLEGRKKGTESLIGVSYKTPIIIEETQELIFFPTSSSRNLTCAWISLKHIKTYYRERNSIVIEFSNKQKISLNVSYGIINNQVLRATRLESALRGRKKKMKYN